MPFRNIAMPVKKYNDKSSELCFVAIGVQDGVYSCAIHLTTRTTQSIFDFEDAKSVINKVHNQAVFNRQTAKAAWKLLRRNKVLLIEEEIYKRRKLKRNVKKRS